MATRGHERPMSSLSAALLDHSALQGERAPISQLLCLTNVAYPVVLGSCESKNPKGIHCHAKVVQRWLLCLCESARACCACVSSCAYVRASAAQVNYFVRFSVCVILCTALQP